jgi:hypothetical protein
MLAGGQPCEPLASASASCIPLIIWSKAAPGPGTAVHGASLQLIEIDAEQIEHNRAVTARPVASAKRDPPSPKSRTIEQLHEEWIWSGELVHRAKHGRV